MRLIDKIEAQQLRNAEAQAKAAAVVGGVFGVAPDKIAFESLPAPDDTAAVTGIFAAGFKGAEPLQKLLSDALGVETTPLFTPEGLVKGIVFPNRNVAQAVEALQSVSPEQVTELATMVQQAKDPSASRGATR